MLFNRCCAEAGYKRAGVRGKFAWKRRRRRRLAEAVVSSDPFDFVFGVYNQ